MAAGTFWTRAEENRRRTLILLALFLGLALAVAWAVHYVVNNWYFPAAVAGIGMGIGLLAIKLDTWLLMLLTGPREATHEEFTVLDNLVQEMANAAVLPPPRCMVIETDAPNAFAMGGGIDRSGKRDKGIICVTRGLLDRLDRAELEGVIAHELAHIANEDTRLMSRAFVLSMVITLLCDVTVRWGRWGRRSRDSSEDKSGGLKTILAVITLILAPLAAKLLTLAISRQREFLADAEAARLTRNPAGLARALQKIADFQVEEDYANLATAHMYIMSPLRPQSRFSSLFSTHPPTPDRIARLMAM